MLGLRIQKSAVERAGRGLKQPLGPKRRHSNSFYFFYKKTYPKRCHSSSFYFYFLKNLSKTTSFWVFSTNSPSIQLVHRKCKKKKKKVGSFIATEGDEDLLGIKRHTSRRHVEGRECGVMRNTDTFLVTLTTMGEALTSHVASRLGAPYEHLSQLCVYLSKK